MGLESRYDSKVIAKLWGDTQRMIAVIVGEVTQLQTQPFGKFKYDVPDVVAQRYRIRILGQDPPDKDESMLPVAYPLQNNSGLGAQDAGTIRYTPNTYVYVSKDPSSGSYLIEKVVPNYIAKPLIDFYGGGTQALSGFLPDSTVPQSYFLKGDFNYAELFGAQAPSDEDIRMSYNTKLPTFTSACKPINTQGVNDSINNFIKEVENLKTGLTGSDSFLATSGNFISDAQNTINGAQIASGINIGEESFDISLGNAAGDIANIIAALVQQMRRFVLRKITTVINNLIGNVPLSARYLANEGTDLALSAISCLFFRILQGLEGMIAKILRSFINKILNASTCLAENLLAGLIGNIIGNIVGAINSILSSIGNIIGTAIDFAVDILDFVISILDFAKCPVKNECPQTDQWDFLNGSSSPKAVLDFNSIFEQAKGIVGNVSESVNDITATFDDLIDDWNFSNSDGSPFDPLGDINIGSIWQSVIDGSCNTGAVDCGPPNVVFWGGNGSGASGNAVVNAVGEILGVQIITPGNYTSPPLIEFQDACGNGKGATGITIIDQVDAGTNGDTDITKQTYDITDVQGTITISPELKDFITVTRYNEIVASPQNSVTYRTTPLYRYYNPTTLDHFTGLNSTPPGGYINEGIFANVFVGAQPPGTVPLVDAEPNKPQNSYTAYVFPANGNSPFKINDGEIATTLLYAKTNNRNVLFTVDENEGSPEYFLDRTNNAYGYAFYAPTNPVNLTVNDAKAYDGTGTEGHLVGSIGYYIDVRDFGDNPDLKVTGVTKRLRASGLAASDRSITLSSTYPQSVNTTRFKVAFDMTNSLEPGRQATYVRGFNINLGAVDDTTNGVSDVVILDSGYGYEGFPYGDKGGSGRVWANRCQSTVLRANYDWDIPYSNGQTVTVFYGDTVKLPGKNAVVIDESFTEDLIPGCIINGVNPRLKDMTNFDYSHGKVYETGIRHQFGFEVDAQRAFASGFTEQDIRFFLENKFFLRVGPKMREKLLDPNWGRIPEFSVTFTAPGCPPGTPEDPNQPPTDNFNDGEDVISILEGVVIQNPGFGYDDGDTLNISGAEGNLIIQNGAITGVVITNPGIGYTNLPEININTGTGFNAIIKPVLRFVNPNDAGFVVPLGTPVLQVIDCVGKV